jgi:hypothetical protein
LLRALPNDPTSDTPVAPGPKAPRFRATRSGPGCRDRFPRVPVKARRVRRSEVPFIAGGRSRACVSRDQFRARSREIPRRSDPSAAPSLPAPYERSRVRIGLLVARPPSPCTLCSTGLPPSKHTRFSGSGCRPTTSATSNSDARTHSRASDSRGLGGHRPIGRTSEFALAPAALFRERRPSPFRRRTTRAASRDSPFEATPTRRCKHAAQDDHESCIPTVTPLADDAPIRPPLATKAVWTTALDCTGRVALSKGPPPTPPAAAVRRG